MTIGYIYALMALVSFGSLGVLHKLADVKGCRPPAISVLLYCWSVVFLVVFVALYRGDGLGAPPTVLSVAMPFGMTAAMAILALQSALPFGSIATSWLAINLSAGIPTLASVLLYHEPLSATKLIALVLIVASMLLLWRDKQIAERRQ